jgi:hypothetical protein
MWSEIVVVNLVARNDWSFRLPESSHDLLPVPDLTVEAFHHVLFMSP